MFAKRGSTVISMHNCCSNLLSMSLKYSEASQHTVVLPYTRQEYVSMFPFLYSRRSPKKKNTKVPVQRTNRVTLNTGTQESTFTFAEGPPKCFDYNEEPKFTRIPGLPEYFDYTEQLETTV